MLQKNLLFIGAILFGLIAVSLGLLSGHKVNRANVNLVSTSQPSFSQTIETIDSEFERVWKEQNLETAKKADDLLIARRLSLALTGTIPSLQEIRLIEKQPEEDRIDWFVSYLLDDERCHDYLAERLARAYVGVEDGPFIVFRRRRFVSWLSDEIEKNRPYDQLVNKLITGKGIWTDFPEVNFVSVTVSDDNNGHPDPIRLAARTTRAFLGMRIDCLQCHDDMLDKVELGPKNDLRSGTQQDFHQLAAFFSEVRASFGGMSDTAEIRHYKYKYLEEPEEEIANPSVPFDEERLPADGTRRERLAKWLTGRENKPFARAIVNRMWATMFGKALVEPIDDIPLYEELPPGMETLAVDFVENGYDLRRLIRLISATRVFQLESRSFDFQPTEVHEKHYAIFPETRLRPEQVAGSIIQASSLSTINNQSHIISKLTKFGQTNDFIQRFGDSGEDEFDEQSATITQRLLLMNGELVRERATANGVLLNASSQLAVLAPTDDKALDTTFLVLLSRLPTDEERFAFLTELEEASNQEQLRILEDLYWLLINGTEFTWNH